MRTAKLDEIRATPAAAGLAGKPRGWEVEGRLCLLLREPEVADSQQASGLARHMPNPQFLPILASKLQKTIEPIQTVQSLGPIQSSGYLVFRLQSFPLAPGNQSFLSYYFQRLIGNQFNQSNLAGGMQLFQR
jgi:hypothetical protein